MFLLPEQLDQDCHFAALINLGKNTQSVGITSATVQIFEQWADKDVLCNSRILLDHQKICHM